MVEVDFWTKKSHTKIAIFGVGFQLMAFSEIDK